MPRIPKAYNMNWGNQYRIHNYVLYLIYYVLGLLIDKRKSGYLKTVV